MFEEVEEDHATLSYVSSWLAKIERAKTLNEAQDFAHELKQRVDGQMNALKGQLVRMRTPDS